MAQINKPDEYFNTVLYTGNGSTQSITGVNFQPDWVWIKNRSSVTNHEVADSVRGANKLLKPNDTDAEQSISTKITSFDSDGFGVGTDANVNGSGNSLVSWNWLADNTSGSSNTDGSITSTVSANTTSGFSIVSYTGNSTSGATVGHSLGTTPSTIIVKVLNEGTYNWNVYTKSLGATKTLKLNLTNAEQTSSIRWNDTEPTSSVFSLGNAGEVNETGKNYIAYCFAEKKGFSKFGSYTGNGYADGTFVYTGFKPAFVIVKRTDTTNNWLMYDNKRDPDNLVGGLLFPNLSNAEDIQTTANVYDFTSNGFKARSTYVATNASGGTYIYMAFAENPLVGTNNIPATAR
jgi:hypothetical protein